MIFDAVRPETVNSVAQACRQDDSLSLKVMIEQGCGRDGLRQKDNRGWEPIHEACHAKAIPCLRILLEEDCVDINAKTWPGFTPLNLAACQQNSYEVVKLLLEHGADVNCAEDFGLTPLHQATSRLDRYLVFLLVTRGADVNKRSAWSTTPIHSIFKDVSSENEETVVDILKLLVKHGAEVDTADDNELTPLIIAAGKGLLGVCKFLLETNIRLLNMEAEDGANALMLACQNGHTSVVKYLLEQSESNPEHCIDVNKRAMDGVMALHLAAEVKKNSSDVMELIINKTDLKKVKEVKKHSPFHIAIMWENWHTLKILASRLQPEAFHIQVDYADTDYSTWHGYTLLNPLSHLVINCDTIPTEIMSEIVTGLMSCLKDKEEKSLPIILSFGLYKSGFKSNLERDYRLQEFDSKSHILRRLYSEGILLLKRDLPFLLFTGHPADIFLLAKEGYIKLRYLTSINLFQKINKFFCSDADEFSMWPIKMIFLLHRLGFMTASILKQLKHMLLVHSADKEAAKNILTRLLPNYNSAPESLKVLARRKIHLVASEGINVNNVEDLQLPVNLQQYLLFEDNLTEILNFNIDKL